MQAAVEIVTPAMAKEYRERGYPNRPLKQNVVQRYASDMTDGLWQPNGQGIIFDSQGRLLDGQHRLEAIIMSGVSISMLVVRGVDPKTFVTMDSGTVRTLADVLGIEDYKYRHNTAAAAKVAYNYIAGVSLDYVVSRGVLERFLSNHEYLAKVTELACAPNKRLPKTALAAVFFLANEGRTLDKEVDEFLEGLVFGDRLWRGDARLTFREWYAAQIADKNTSARGGTAFNMFGAVARAWNAFASGRELTMLRNYHGVNRENLEIHGFDMSRYGDVEDKVVKAREISLANLKQAHSANEKTLAAKRLEEIKARAAEAPPKTPTQARMAVQAKAMGAAARR